MEGDGDVNDLNESFLMAHETKFEISAALPQCGRERGKSATITGPVGSVRPLQLHQDLGGGCAWVRRRRLDLVLALDLAPPARILCPRLAD